MYGIRISAGAYSAVLQLGPDHPAPPPLTAPTILLLVCRECWVLVKVRIENEVHRLVVNRDRKYTNFVEVSGRKGKGGGRRGGSEGTELEGKREDSTQKQLARGRKDEHALRATFSWR